MLLILQMMVVLTIQTPFYPPETPLPAQINITKDLKSIAGTCDLSPANYLPSNLYLEEKIGHAFLSTDMKTSASNFPRSQLRKVRRIRQLLCSIDFDPNFKKECLDSPANRPKRERHLVDQLNHQANLCRDFGYKKVAAKWLNHFCIRRAWDGGLWPVNRWQRW